MEENFIQEQSNNPTDGVIKNDLPGTKQPVFFNRCMRFLNILIALGVISASVYFYTLGGNNIWMILITFFIGGVGIIIVSILTAIVNFVYLLKNKKN